MLTFADLQADAANPRTIDDEAAAGLAASLEIFGDLSGIVFNRRTNELVAGHQRVQALAGDAAVYHVIDAARELGALEVDGRWYTVRVVDWSPEKQRAANLAANNPRIQGKFTDELEAYLAPAKGELEPELWDDVGLSLLLAPPPELMAPEEWTVVVDCECETDQQTLYEELRGRGFEVKLTTM